MSASTQYSDLPPPVARVLQIVTIALSLGIVGFLVVVLVLHQQGLFPGPAPQPPIIPLAAVLQFVMIFAVWLFLPAILLRQGVIRIARDQPDALRDTQKLLNLKHTSQIVGCALLEGAAYMALIGYLMERQAYTLGIGLTCLLLILVTFPTHDRIKHWLMVQQDRLEELRRLG